MPNWTALLKEIASTKQEGDTSGADIVRRKYLAKLHALTNRNIIAYYSGFLQKPKIYDDCKDMGLNVEMLEDPGNGELQDLVLTVHHCFMITLANTPAFKIIENHLGRAMIRQQQLIIQQPPQIVFPPELVEGLKEELERSKKEQKH
jgi:hypothetical protein